MTAPLQGGLYEKTPPFLIFLDSPPGPQHARLPVLRQALIVHRKDRAVLKLHRGRVPQIAVRAVVAQDDLLVPVQAVRADQRALAVRLVAVAVHAHDFSRGVHEQMRRRPVAGQAPRLAPGIAPVGGAAHERGHYNV